MNRPRQSVEFEAALRKAVGLHQQGQLAQAEVLYRAILDQAPNHADATQLLGVLALLAQNSTPISRTFSTVRLNGCLRK